MNKTAFRNLWYKLSSNQRFLIRKLYYFPVDLYDRITGKRNKYVPPRGYIYTGSSAGAKNYLKQGVHQLELLKRYADLLPENKVLDIGSGVGRTAIALKDYLNNNGRYEGFDVVKLGVDWCTSKITKDFPSFKFTYIPLFNDLYNKSTLKAEKFIFPYERNYFDAIFSFSVFTHMQIAEIQNYFREISKVLKKDGLVFSTFFLYDNDNENFIATREGFSFSVKKEGYRLMNKNVKSGNIAIHKDKLQQMLSKENLEAVNIVDGFWKDEKRNLEKIEYQDILVFKKQ